MKIMIVEMNENEIRTGKTLFNTICDAVNDFVDGIIITENNDENEYENNDSEQSEDSESN